MAFLFSIGYIMPCNMKPLTMVGKIKDAHGLRGDLYVLLFAKSADWLDDFTEAHLGYEGHEDGETLKTFKVLEAHPHKQGLRLKLEHFKDRTEAEKWINQYLYISSEYLISDEDDDKPFLKELLGVEVIDKTLGSIGVVQDFSSNGVQDLLVVKGPEKTYEIPLVSEFWLEFDREAKTILMNLPDGLLEI